MNLIPHAIWLFINLGGTIRDVLLMSVSQGKKYLDIRVWGYSLTSSRTNSSGWNCLKILPKGKTLYFFDFSLLFSTIKRKIRRRRWRVVNISIRRTLHVFDFSVFLDYLQEKEDGMQFSILQLHSHWFGTI